MLAVATKLVVFYNNNGLRREQKRPLEMYGCRLILAPCSLMLIFLCNLVVTLSYRMDGW